MPKKPENINEGTRLALFLKERKLVSANLAKEMDMPQSTMARYVSGVTKTPQRVVDYLFKRYNLNLHWWYTGKGTKVKDAAAPKGLVVDLGMIADKIEILTARIDEQDKVIKKLVRDLYDKTKS